MKISIASGKGGTGKTTLSTNLSDYLSKEYKTVLVDLDVEEPNSGLFFQGELINKEDKHKMIPNWIKEDCIFCGICQKVCAFNAIIQIPNRIMVFPELCHGCYACSELCPTKALPMVPKKMGELKEYKKENLYFIESRLLIGEEQAVPLISQTIDYTLKAHSDADFFIFDSPPGTSCPVIEATKDSDLIILVTEPTPFGFHDLKLAVETMEELKKDFCVVINRYGVGNSDVEDYCKEKNIPIIAKLPYLRKAAELYSQGKLLYKDIPQIENELKKIENFLISKKGKL